jgi:flavorubredoxin
MKKVLLIIGTIFGVMIFCAVIFVLVVLSTNLPKGNHKEVLQSKDQPLRKTFVVYQPSISDISSRMAHWIAKGLNDGGYEVTLNNPGKHLPVDISTYQLVVFGSAAYYSQPSKALIEYMASIKDYSSVKVVLYSTGIVPNNGDEYNVMEKALNGLKPYKRVKFNANAKEGNDKTAYEFGKELSKK